MPLARRPATAYFEVRPTGSNRVPMLRMSSEEGGAPLWAIPVEGADTETVAASLAEYLDDTLERNVEPVMADSVFQAPDVLELEFDVYGAIIAGIAEANGPVVDWDAVTVRLDRLRAQVEYLTLLVQRRGE